MLTTSIRQRCRDNLNRDDSGIDTKIQDWLNDTKRRIEQRVNMDYMRAFTAAMTVTNANQGVAITNASRLKDIISVKYRKTLPAGELETSWTPIPILSEAEVLHIEGFDTAGVVVTGAPLGYTLEETTLTVHPKPETGKTYTLAVVEWLFSANWTFGAGEEPYLAKFAFQTLIAGATALGFAYLGELGDSDRWEARYEKFQSEFVHHEMARALEGEITLRPQTGADDRRPSQQWGWGN